MPNSKVVAPPVIASILLLIVTGAFEPSVSISQQQPGLSSNLSSINTNNNLLAQRQPSVCRCVVFRMDDLQDNWLETAQLAAMNLFITKNQSLTIGLIMNAIGNDSKILGQISLGREKGLFELALHGWNHIDYTKLSEEQQRISLKLANEKMIHLFGNRSDIFITPYDTFDNNTIYATDHLGIHILSTALSSEGSFDRNSSVLNLNKHNKNDMNVTSPVYHIPAMAFFKEDERNKQAIKIPTHDILSNVDDMIKKFGYSVIVFHPQDFVHTDQKGQVINSVLDTSQMRDLSQLIDHILSKGTKIVSLDKLIGYVQAAS